MADIVMVCDDHGVVADPEPDGPEVEVSGPEDDRLYDGRLWKARQEEGRVFAQPLRSTCPRCERKLRWFNYEEEGGDD